MKKIYSAILFAGALFVSNNASSQTYEAWGATPEGYDYDTIFNYGDTLRFSFSGIMPGALGDAHLMVYREGDFGDNGAEWIDIWEEVTSDFIGTVQNNPMGDCAPEDSTDIVFDGMMISTWQNAGVLEIKLRGSDGVDFFCTVNRVKVRLVYDYCPFGAPVEYASFSFSDDAVCSNASPVTMVGSPAGGTYSGTGVSGSQFNPSGLNPGLYPIEYTATDGIGCVTSTIELVEILSNPTSINEVICEGTSPVLNVGGLPHGFFADPNMTIILDTASIFTFPAVTTSPTTYYYSAYDAPMTFMLDSMPGTNAYVIDHAATSGDDRGGYAFTDHFVYITGDAATARYDLDLQDPATLLPVRDALFSNMRNGKIYSLYNTGSATMPYNWPGSFTVDALVRLDENLDPTAEIITLSSSFVLSTNSSQNGLFAGFDDVIVKSGDNDEVFHIDIETGTVTSLGVHYLNLWWGENFFDYGVAGFDGTDHYIYYRDYNGENAVSHNLTTDMITEISDFSAMSDWAGFMVNPKNNRVYFHYESNGQFGGSDETFGYMDAEFTLTSLGLPGTFGCPASIEYTFNTVDLGPDTTLCIGHSIALEPGLGYNSYTWNGVNNDWNVYPVSVTGTYDVAVEDDFGCILTDEINVNVVVCLGTEELSALNVVAYPVPNTGQFTLDFGGMINNPSIQIFDLQGKIVYQNMENGGVSMIKINADHLESGMYVVAVNTEEGSQRIQITVQK